MAVVPNDIINECQRHMRDTGASTWTDTDVAEYFNNAVYALMGVRPFVWSVIASRTLVADVTKQSIPTGHYMLIDMPRNMGTTGLVEGKIITPMDRWQIDLLNQHWHKGSGKTFIEHYSYEPTKSLTDFYVFPKVHATTTVQVEMNTAKYPTKVTAANQASATVTIVSTALVATVVHTAHGLLSGDTVVISGANESDYNGTFVIDTVTTNGYNYTMLADPVDTATGTITSVWNILLDQTYENFIKEWIFYEMYNKNTSVASYTQSQRHLANAAQLIGLKIESLVGQQGKTKEGA